VRPVDPILDRGGWRISHSVNDESHIEEAEIVEEDDSVIED
jgi:hypothetical protein